MSAADSSNNEELPSADICANCGKGEEGSNSLKACTACKMVKYCNRECQIAHRPQHKRECKRRAAELHDENLFKQPPQQCEDCPICFLQIPFLLTGSKWYACCGKTICSGCVHAPIYDNEGNMVADTVYDNGGNAVTDKTCPFCRTPGPTSNEEAVERTKNRVKVGDAIAIYNLGAYYHHGEAGFSQDYDKALELWQQAGKLGYATAYYNIGICYYNGEGVEMDKKKARHYLELAAIGGNVKARHNLGAFEANAGNPDRAIKHYMIALTNGNNDSLKGIQVIFKKGYATKEDYEKALRYRQEYLGNIRSEQRDKAAAASDENKYIDSILPYWN